MDETAPSAIRCELCGATDAWTTHLPRVIDYISDETFSIRRCSRCGLCVTDPLVGDDRIAAYYPARYRVDRQKYSGGLRVELRAGDVQGAIGRGRRGRLLDLGCGTGAFAVAMKQRGWEVAVTEINDAVLDRLRATGIEAKRPDEAMRDGFAAPFDAITCWHVLEHVEHPVELAKWARRHLTPDGVFQVTVPNLGSWQAHLFGANWMHLDPPRHRHHFTPGTLARLLIDAGFQIVDSSSFAFEYDLFGALQSVLNGVCTKPNVLFEKVSAAGAAHTTFATRDVILSYALTPLISTAAIPFCLASWLAARGATLTVTARPAAGDQVAKEGA